ncbi:MAG TPA: alpha/beta hydrolase [Candidatus Dormibacteraeota bacterium]|nr:alpha/beta hydrolase [Candidatus Dormibacteraeota bacterium]
MTHAARVEGPARPAPPHPPSISTDTTGLIKVRDVSLFVEVVGDGSPIVLMHGGPGADHWTLLPLRPLKDRFTLVFYDHRCNGRSVGAPVSSMTWDNLTADADALRQRLGFDRWAVLGHSFGGHVALEYALRYPKRVSRLVLMDTGGDSTWARDRAPELLTRRGYSAEKVELVRRWFRGEFAPSEMIPILMHIGDAYSYRPNLWLTVGDLIHGEWHTKLRPEPLIYAGNHLLKRWSVMNRLGEIQAPTLLIAGSDDFLFPPEHQRQLAAGIRNSRLEIIDRAGHNPHSEHPGKVITTIAEFLSAA